MLGHCLATFLVMSFVEGCNPAQKSSPALTLCCRESEDDPWKGQEFPRASTLASAALRTRSEWELALARRRAAHATALSLLPPLGRFGAPCPRLGSAALRCDAPPSLRRRAPTPKRAAAAEELARTLGSAIPRAVAECFAAARHSHAERIRRHFPAAAPSTAAATETVKATTERLRASTRLGTRLALTSRGVNGMIASRASGGRPHCVRPPLEADVVWDVRSSRVAPGSTLGLSWGVLRAFVAGRGERAASRRRSERIACLRTAAPQAAPCAPRQRARGGPEAPHLRPPHALRVSPRTDSDLAALRSE